MLTIVHTLNKAHLIPNCDKTPYELWHGKPKIIKHFKVFKNKCYIKNNDEKLGKFDAWFGKGIFLGYSSKCKGYRCYNKILHKIMEYIYVKVDDELPNKKKNTNFINPPYHHHHISKENQVQYEELQDTETHLKGTSIYTEKNHPKNQLCKIKVKEYKQGGN